jgi:acyl-coenzyme A thioesterase 13
VGWHRRENIQVSMGSLQAAVGFLAYNTSRTQEDGEEVFDTTALRGIYDIRAEDGRVTCRFRVLPRVQNRNGTLHGGCIATLVDVVGTAAILTNSRRGGVSLNINTNYLSPMPGNGIVLIDAKVLRIGRSIATASVDLRDVSSGKLVAQGQHVKFISDTEPDLSPLSQFWNHPVLKPEVQISSKL